MTFVLRQLEDWQSVIDAILPKLQPGMIVTLAGPLGAGKTTFVQLLAARLGIEVPAKSPTFALMRSYPLPKPIQHISHLIHIDAYRLEKPEDALALDLDTTLAEPGTLALIEWPENIESTLRHFTKKITIQIAITNEGRNVEVSE